MKETIKLLLFVTAGLIAGAMLRKCQSPPGSIHDFTECVTDTTIVYDTLRYIAPMPQAELVVGTRPYTLPMFYFIGRGTGGLSRQCDYQDSLCLYIPTETTYFGTGAGAGAEPPSTDSYNLKEKVSASSRGSVSQDSAIVGDSANELKVAVDADADSELMVAELPIIQRHYADSTYEAWVSGPIDPRLDSARVFIPQTYISMREWKPPKRWHIGATIGYGFTPQGFQPYFGLSITYSFISF